MRLPAWGPVACAVGLAGCGVTPVSPANPVPVGGNPYGVPRSVALPLPASMTGSPTAAGFHTAAAESSLAATLRGNVAVYVGSAILIDAILDGAARADLVPGVPRTFTDSKTGQTYTALLQVEADHALISIGQGNQATGSPQIIGISYSSPTQGEAVYRSLTPDPELGRVAFATRYDLTAGTATADGISDTSVFANANPGGEAAAHWVFTKLDSTSAASPSFSMQVSANLDLHGNPTVSGVYALSANFLPDGSAAAIGGLQTGATGDRFAWWPTDNVSWSTVLPPPHAHYVTSLGGDLPPLDASAALVAALPADSSLYQPFPSDPGQGDPFSDPRFAFPR